MDPVHGGRGIPPLIVNTVKYSHTVTHCCSTASALLRLLDPSNASYLETWQILANVGTLKYGHTPNQDSS